MSKTHNEQLEILVEKFSQARAVNCRVFPEELWRSAIALIHTMPLKDICRAISVQPQHLRKKAQEFATPRKQVDFVEIESCKTLVSNDIVIDLETPSGFKAKIQGSSYCLSQVLAQLFQGVSCSK